MVVGNQVVTVHDLTAVEHPEWFDRKYALWHRTLIPIVLRRCRHIISVSNYTKERIQERYNIQEEKITVIHNGVDTRFAPVDDGAISRVRAELGIPDGPYLLSLSAIQPRKNLRRLLNVWSRLQKKLSNPPTLVLAGGTGSSTVFRNFSLKSPPPNVHFTGYVDDHLLPALYAGAKIFVYPSLYEGFGFPVLEAMRCGTAVLTSNVTSLPEVAGDAAMLVDPYSEKDIQRGLVKLMHEERKRTHLREKGRERAMSFQWEESARKTGNILRHLSK
jgi:glycosyltransferase involved in cell wall biosynthesis